MNELGSGHCIAPTVSAVPQRASPVRLSEPHFDDQPRCNDAECSERSYDYAKDKLTGFAPSRLHRCVLKARILLRKPVLSLDTLFSRQVSHVADPKFVPDLGSTEALKASAILVRYCHCPALPCGHRLCGFLCPSLNAPPPIATRGHFFFSPTFVAD